MNWPIYLAVTGALATAATAGVIGLLLAPLAKPLAWALIIGVATSPYYNKIKKRMPNHPNWSAGLMVLLMTLCLIGPLSALVVGVSQNAADWLKESEKLVQSVNSTKQEVLGNSPTVNRIIRLIDRVGINITGYAARFASTASQYLVNAAANAAKNLAAFLFTLTFALFTLFFIYRDGESIILAAVARFATNQEKTLYYLSEMQSTTTAVIVGTVVTSLIQGALAGIGYFFSGIPLAVLWGLLTAVAGLLPMVGTALMWVPLAAFLAFGGEYFKAMLLSLWCLIAVIGITDTVIRPLMVGAKRKVIPTLAVVLGAVGGVMIIGVLGLILGPLLFSIVAMVWGDMTGTGEARYSHRDHSN